ncbi:MAG: ATP-binding protein [Gammaproteobacteria bacterium]|jgi:two-component system sensor histidine kinase BaeS|nr:two-component sensor histidine kinase [Chromatiales bacterium]MDP6674437.1 ATP-binding protein [Gammaproteobacteria bacterium]
MQLRIWHKLFLALLAAILVVTVVALLLTRVSFNRGFLDYVNRLESQRTDALAVELAVLYEESGNFERLLDERNRWHALMDEYAQRGRPGRFGGPTRRVEKPGFRRRSKDRPDRPPGPGPAPGPLGALQRIDLLNADGATLIGKPGPRERAVKYAIEVGGTTVGYLRYVPISALTELDEEADQLFIRQQQQGAFGIAITALLIAGALAVWLARQLVAPVRAIAGGARALAAGNFTERITVTTQDELGQLADDFNVLAETLQSNRTARRRWVVDISHELRTPLSILGGELQAIEDGVREWNTETRASLQTEVQHLARLVEDLHELSLSDAGGLDYQKRDVDLVGLVEQALDGCRGRIRDRNLSLETDLTDREIMINGDPNRLKQLIINLLENSCRYTDGGGRIRITCTTTGVPHIIIEDTAPGVPADALPLVFDRLYRVDSSRNRDSGGSGLGLAICKSIVAAHGGVISATPSDLGGLKIQVEFPNDQA